MAGKKREIIYAFIDSQNLNLGVRSQGWKLDWRKLRQYLRNKYNVSQAIYLLDINQGMKHCTQIFKRWVIW